MKRHADNPALRAAYALSAIYPRLRSRTTRAGYRLRRTFAHSLLTYDNQSFTDGAGAQFQRVLGVYALARDIDAKYLHSPVSLIGYRGTPNSRDKAGDKILNELDDLTLIASDSGAEAMAARATVVSLSSPRSHELEKHAGTSKHPTLFKITLPYQELDRDPAIWNRLRPVLRHQTTRRPPLRIAVHVRRGDNHFVAAERLLPNSYYISVAQRLGSLLVQLDIPHRFEIFSETLTIGTRLTPSDFTPGMTSESFAVAGDHDRFGEFDALSPVDLHLDTPLMEAIGMMVSADVLITSKSSLSIVVGLLNPDRLILFHPFWHAPMAHWVTTSADGQFNEAHAAKMLRRYLSGT
ncbi:MAG: hypothetical protein GEU95_19685 [Rhizobiales bacterium]|nr:hypothetical protein [Hyphomicrobiales bacterium]